MSSQHLKPPSSTSHPHRTVSSSTPPQIPRPPISSHPSTTIAEATLFQGTHPITIDAETIVHPRARIYSFAGPVRIGRGCVLGEKCVVGSEAAGAGDGPSTTDADADADTFEKEGDGITIGDSVTVAPLSTVQPGSTLAEAAVVDTLATIARRASIGRHAKVCAGCTVPVDARVGDWMVVWGAADGLARRKRVVGAGAPAAGVDGRMVEDSRLVVLGKEREALSRLLVPAGASRRR